MNDDALLEELARLARAERDETAEDDARWAALAADSLTPDEMAALRAEADGSEEAARAIEAYRPLGDEFRARMTALAADALVADTLPAETSPAEMSNASKAGDPDGTREEPSADDEALTGPNVIDARRRWRRRGPGLALAAALLLAILWPAGSGPPLPDYAFRIDGEVEVHRSAETVPNDGLTETDASRRIFVDGNRLTLLWTPSTAVTEALTVRAYTLRGNDLDLLALPVAEVSEEGAVRIEAEIGLEVDWPAGESLLVVVVAQRGGLPDAETLRARARGPSPFREPGWIAWTVPVLRR